MHRDGAFGKCSDILGTFFVSYGLTKSTGIRVYGMHKCWLRAFMPALFEDIFFSFIVRTGGRYYCVCHSRYIHVRID